jgi:hypothetical protein
MAGVQLKRMNWYQRRSLHQVMETWRQRRREMISQFQSVAGDAAARFASAQSNLYAGKATLAGQASVARVQAELKEVVRGLAVDKMV